MLKDFKTVIRELNNYKQANHKKFWDRNRINQVISNTIWKTRYLWLSTILILIITFKPENKVLTDKVSFFIQIIIPQGFLFLYFIFIIITIAIISYHQITHEYNDHLTQTYPSFSYFRVVKLFTTLSIVIVLSLVASAQITYTKQYLIPPIESCSYYDLYGNLMYSSQEMGHCPELQNIEISYNPEDLDRTIVKFEIFEKNLAYNQYKLYEYHYKYSKIYQRNEKIYNLNQDEVVSLDKNEINRYTLISNTQTTNTYLLNQFISTTNQSEIVSTLNENNEIVVTYDNDIYDNQHPIEKYRINNVSDQINYNDTYKVSKSYSDITVTYDASLYHPDYLDDKFIVNLKTSTYQDFYIDDVNLWILTSTHSNNQSYEFDIHSVNNNVKYIDQKQNNTLLYRHVLVGTDFGFKVLHYSYRREHSGKLMDIDEIKRQNYCFTNINYNYNNYLDMFDLLQVQTCQENLIYNDNPIFLNYHLYKDEIK